MKKYLDLKNTPLKFHRIYAAVVLPLDMFLNIYSLITIIASITKNGAGTWDWISLGTTIIYLVLIMASFRGLLVFKKRGLYAVWTLLGLQIVDNAYTFYLSYSAGDTVFVLSSALSILILSSIIVYYVLRRNLFTKEGIDVAAFMAKKSEEVQRQQESFVPTETIVDVEEDVGEYDCPRCGYHITDGKVFCPKCGAQTRSVRR
ncbi:MAG: zinc ribbon domain-containing protein [Spirochaetales bacterium]|nr:zinc ribbon domain-containing protein [Spirochaetales bacterium]MDD6842080.1 zinc ribbon domain-containing protein [Spirochaetales bacterium]